jgi:hypothetical protein
MAKRAKSRSYVIVGGSPAPGKTKQVRPTKQKDVVEWVAEAEARRTRGRKKSLTTP